MTDPDYRFTLANERTLLAWLRTTLALLAAGSRWSTWGCLVLGTDVTDPQAAGHPALRHHVPQLDGLRR